MKVERRERDRAMGGNKRGVQGLIFRGHFHT